MTSHPSTQRTVEEIADDLVRMDGSFFERREAVAAALRTEREAHPPAAASDEETARRVWNEGKGMVVDRIASAITAARKEEREKAEGRITELALQMRGLADKLATAEAERFDEIKENAAYHSRAFVAERDLATARRSALEEAARIVLTNTLEWPPTRNELAAAIRSAIEPKEQADG